MENKFLQIVYRANKNFLTLCHASHDAIAKIFVCGEGLFLKWPRGDLNLFTIHSKIFLIASLGKIRANRSPDTFSPVEISERIKGIYDPLYGLEGI